jgi:hypothetical protein
MGLFDTQGIHTVHLNLADGGIPFERLRSLWNNAHIHSLAKRSVVIHHCAFSPENAQFQMDDKVDVCSFFSLAVHETPQEVKKVECKKTTNNEGNR